MSLKQLRPDGPIFLLLHIHLYAEMQFLVQVLFYGESLQGNQFSSSREFEFFKSSHKWIVELWVTKLPLLFTLL